MLPYLADTAAVGALLKGDVAVTLQQYSKQKLFNYTRIWKAVRPVYGRR